MSGSSSTISTFAIATPLLDAHRATTRHHLAHLDRGVAVGTEQVEGVEEVVAGDGHDHPEAEVEDPRHLLGVDAAQPLDLGEDARRLPRPTVDLGVAPVR